MDRNAREDQIQMNQLDERLKNLKDEYRQMKIQFEQQIQSLEVIESDSKEFLIPRLTTF